MMSCEIRTWWLQSLYFLLESSDLEASVMQLAKPQPTIPLSHIGASRAVLAAPLPIRLPADAPSKAVDASPSAWAPANHRGTR